MAALDTVATQSTTDMPDAISHQLTRPSRLRLHYKTFISRKTVRRAQQVARLQERIAELEMQQAMPDYNKSPDEMEFSERSISLPPNIWAMATVAITAYTAAGGRKRQAQCLPVAQVSRKPFNIARIIFQPWVQHLGRSTKDIKLRTPFPHCRQRPNYRQRSALRLRLTGADVGQRNSFYTYTC